LVDFGYGATVPLWWLIPHAVWPDKPNVGGGADMITHFTGIRIAVGTSMGAGLVFEFYVNFGVPGVLIGFFGFGCLLMWLDLGIMRAIRAGDMRGLIVRSMPGLMLLPPDLYLLEIFVGCTAANLAAQLVIRLRFFETPTTRPSRRLA
jgi:hypothetical protein